MNRVMKYGILAGLSVSASASFAQTSDVDALRTQLESVSARLAELEATADSTESSWTDKITIKGDLRYRYEHKEKDGSINKDRNRIRARIGAYADVNDEVKVSIRIASGDSENPTSTNETLDGYSKNKTLWLDLAYLTYSPAAVEGLSASMGKMKQPWVQVSDLMFDSDVNPDGISAAYKAGSDALTFSSVVGYHIMNERTSDDVTLLSGQLAVIADLSDDISFTAGVGGFVYDNIKDTAAVSLGNNSDDGAGNYRYDYEIVDGIAKLDINKGSLPLKVYGEYLSNVANGVSESDSWLVGIGTKYKKFGFDYTFRETGSDAVLDYLDDGDFGGAGGKGHKVKASYKIAKNFSVGATYFRIEEEDHTNVDLAQIDLAVKF